MTGHKRRQKAVRQPAPPLKRAPAPPSAKELQAAARDTTRLQSAGVALTAANLAAAAKARGAGPQSGGRARGKGGRSR